MGFLIWKESNPFAVNCWVHAVLTVAGAGAGAFGGLMRQLVEERQTTVE